MERIQAAFNNQIGSSEPPPVHSAAKAHDGVVLSYQEPEAGGTSSKSLELKQDDVRSASISTGAVHTKAPSSLMTKVPVSLLHPKSRLGKRPLSAAPVSLFRDRSDTARDEEALGWSSSRQTSTADAAPSSSILKRPQSATAAAGQHHSRHDESEPGHSTLPKAPPTHQAALRSATRHQQSEPDPHPGSKHSLA